MSVRLVGPGGPGTMCSPATHGTQLKWSSHVHYESSELVTKVHWKWDQDVY
jgi:hypothetical protein